MLVSPSSDRRPTSELSDARTAETSSSARPASDIPVYHHHPQQQQQQAVVIVEQPPSPAVPPSPPTSLPLADNQSAASVRTAERLSPRQSAAVPTGDTLPPVAEEEIVVTGDSAVGRVTGVDEVFSPTAGDDGDVERTSQTGSSAFVVCFYKMTSSEH